MARLTNTIPLMITLSLFLTLVSARNMPTTQATTEKPIGITDEKNVHLGLGGFGGLGAGIGLGGLNGFAGATGGLGLGLGAGKSGIGGGGLGGGLGGGH